jgi:hypothetical protein
MYGGMRPNVGVNGFGAIFCCAMKTPRGGLSGFYNFCKLLQLLQAFANFAECVTSTPLPASDTFGVPNCRANFCNS